MDLFFRFWKDSLFRGFVLLSVLLLGVGLEQGLLPSHGLKYALYFLTGNILGLGIGIFLWRKEKIASQTWFIEGLLVALLIWKQNEFLFLLLGLLFGPLILHLFILAHGRTLKDILLPIGSGIIWGNILLYLLKLVPLPISLAFLALFLAGWKVERPKKFGSNLSFSPTGRLYLFWLFFLLFYALGGLYYTSLFNLGLSFPQKYFDLISLLAYTVGIGLALLGEKFLFRFFPPLVVVLIGLSLVWQFPSSHFSLFSLASIEASFGLADVFSLAYLFYYSGSILEGMIGLALYPLAIILGIIFQIKFSTNFLQQYQWALASLFATIIPAIFCSRYLLERSGVDREMKALPSGLGKTDSQNLGHGKFPATTDQKASQGITFEAQKYISQEPQGPIPPTENFPKDLLSDREKEVFALLLKGYKLKDIANELDLALGTVKTFCNRIYEKLGVKGKKDLLRKFEHDHFSQ
ncbi:response regulator transcription factor [Thermodesulfatator autotrophicus]|uniref:response regulator transcription factor n=1 Tax=Thermodesulfatator autotrophicus TaxID=1795632 RepID=UPI0018D3E76F|nr:helix-turn-helix transcriptional regulator [Thermodesulfatator autotrophicus]